jgi:hypothetical protein
MILMHRGRSLGFISFGPRTRRALPAYDPLAHVQRISITGVSTGGAGLEDASRATVFEIAARGVLGSKSGRRAVPCGEATVMT